MAHKGLGGAARTGTWCCQRRRGSEGNLLQCCSVATGKHHFMLCIYSSDVFYSISLLLFQLSFAFSNLCIIFFSSFLIRVKLFISSPFLIHVPLFCFLNSHFFWLSIIHFCISWMIIYFCISWILFLINGCFIIVHEKLKGRGLSKRGVKVVNECRGNGGGRQVCLCTVVQTRDSIEVCESAVQN